MFYSGAYLGGGGEGITVSSKILASANLPKYESHEKCAQTFKGCNSRFGIIFVEDMSFYGEIFSFYTKKPGHF